MNALFDRLKEVSTWQGIISIVTAFGVVISPDLSAGIAGVGVALFSLVSIVMRERAK